MRTVMGWEHLHAPDLSGRLVVLTGGSDGLCREAALQLARWGADLVLPVRTPAKGEVVRERIARETGREDAVRLVRLDLASMASVREGASAIAEAVGDRGIDVLVHGAGTVLRRREETADGFERALAVNALAPRLLTTLLQPLVRERIVLVGSHAHKTGRIDLTDMDFAGGRWSISASYGRSKLTAMLWALDLAESLRGTAVDLQIAHPGWVLTNIQNATGSAALDTLVTEVTRPIAMPAARGAESVLFAVTQPLPHGSYVGPDGPMGNRGRPTLLRRSDAANDLALARRVTEWADRRIAGV
ncbi:SDR family NAD(P)-dependent oxidoreductase [Brachybacterium subflavum]|uniref:SDR family NAD(P)-dependent oxidoreductase n=1 Tax=Brachybacterium subflavum TaxID=2585206 RepID=UPI0012667502|nr:SDR family NAD(P)-dependent oxidoreductase [Brachybacterium subflavum]